MLDKEQIRNLQKEINLDKTSLPAIFNALGDEGRLKIFRILMENDNICVSDAAKILSVSVPAASKQLTILEMSGLVEKVRKGQTTCFKIQDNDKSAKSIIEILQKVA